MSVPASILSVGPTGRYLVDATGEPVFLNGDTAWSLVVSARPDQVDRYLEDRARRGFNAIIVNAIEALFSADPPRAVGGLAPFLDGGLSAPNPAYWERVDHVVDAARRLGIHILLAPLYLGYAHPQYPGFDGRDEGWHRTVAAMSEAECRAYGRWVGQRYRDRDNVIWVIGGDRNPGALLSRMRAFVAGITSQDDRHLITAHVHPDASPVEEYEDDGWLSLNQTYSYRIVHKQLLIDYARQPVRPFVLFESTYEGEHDATDLQIRRQAWWALTCGSTGQFFGNFPVWLMPPGWEGALDTPGAQAMGHLGSFVRSIAWWKLAPDRDRRLLNAGLGEGNGLDRATAAIDPAGTTAVVYVPTQRTVAVDLDALSGWTIGIRWFDPVTGAWIDRTTVTRNGIVNLQSPTDQDWVLVLEDLAGGEHGGWLSRSPKP